MKNPKNSILNGVRATHSANEAIAELIRCLSYKDNEDDHYYADALMSSDDELAFRLVADFRDKNQLPKSGELCLAQVQTKDTVYLARVHRTKDFAPQSNCYGCSVFELVDDPDNPMKPASLITITQTPAGDEIIAWNSPHELSHEELKHVSSLGYNVDTYSGKH